MKKVYLLAVCGLVAGSLLARVQLAYGTAPFKKEFDSLYVKTEPASEEEKSLAAAVTKAKCNVCHVGTSKKNRNDYGKAINQFLTKKDIKDTAKIREALIKVADMKSKPGDDSSPTFGELIKQGKLPAEDNASAAK
jgi:hypothetical protein